jgi:hypothetical protein
MTPLPPTHLHFEPRVHEDSGEWWFRVAISTSQIRVEDLPPRRTAYKDTAFRAVNARMDLWGNYSLIEYVNGPQGYVYAHFAKNKTDDERTTPYYEEPGVSRHYEWPTVLHGILFAEDTEFPVQVNIGVNLTVKRARLIARASKTERTFALCRTVVKKYLSDRPFVVVQRHQPAASEVEWVINGQPEKLVCLHDKLTLPAAGGNWSIKYSAGRINGIPGDTRTFPATPMKDWEPFVISQSHRQLDESRMWELIEEWILPPDRAEPNSF